MLDKSTLHDLSKKITDNLPEGLQNVRGEMEQNVKAALQATFAKLDLVTREEFDVQRNVLAKTRKKLEALESQLKSLKK